MILDTEILFNVSNKNKSYLFDKGYDISKDKIYIKVSDLPKFSHYKVKVKCDICGNEKELSYSKYQKNTKFDTEKYCCSQKCATNKLLNTFNKKYGCVSSQHPDIKLKQENTNIKLYGGKSPQCNIEIKKKSYETMIERYGVKYSYQNQDIKDKFLENLQETINKTIKTKIKRGLMVDYENYSTYQEYRKIVESVTRKCKKILYNNWSGYDFYDNEYIKDNLLLESKDKMFPTIDHKISILFGFKNKIDPNIIGSIDNLCITKRSNNSKKHSNNFYTI
jgi:hypothetical protein